ncbi:MAG: hypothetical protein Q4C34_01820 [Bacteroidales bacterium]|nr:hypothetical protein [Bacteroidales bacterium]
MIDNIDDLKQQWRKMNVHADDLDRVNRKIGDRLSSGRVSSLQDRLARRIRRVRWIGLFVVLYSPVIYYTLPLSLTACIVYALFGALMTVLHQLLADYISEQPLVELPVADAIRRAVKIKVYQQQMRAVGICFGAVVVMSIIMGLIDAKEEEMLLGAVVGLAIGLCIGIPRCLRNARLARRLVESLSMTE